MHLNSIKSLKVINLGNIAKDWKWKFYLMINFKRLSHVDSLQHLKQDRSSLIHFGELSTEEAKNVPMIKHKHKRMPTHKKNWLSYFADQCIIDVPKANSPISLTSRILQSLDILFVIMLVEALHFLCITIFNPSPHSWIILL